MLGGIALQTQSTGTQSSIGFGEFLKRRRVLRKLTLREAAALTTDLQQAISPSYLSRVEQGECTPSLPKISGMARVYDVPLCVMIEQFELGCALVNYPIDDIPADPATTYSLATKLQHQGHYLESLALLHASTTRTPWQEVKNADFDTWLDLQLAELQGLNKAGMFESAKTMAESLLDGLDNTESKKCIVWFFFITACRSLAKYDIAESALESLRARLLSTQDNATNIANLDYTHGTIHLCRRNYSEAIQSFQSAATHYETIGNRTRFCQANLHIALAWTYAGKPRHGLERSREFEPTARALGQQRILTYALMTQTVSCFHLQLFDTCRRKAALAGEIAQKYGYLDLGFVTTWYLLRTSEIHHEYQAVAQHAVTLRELLPQIKQSFEELDEFLVWAQDKGVRS